MFFRVPFIHDMPQKDLFLELGPEYLNLDFNKWYRCILQHKLMNIFSIKCYLRVIFKIDFTKNRIFWGISLVKSKPEIHFPGNFLLQSVCTKTFKENSLTFS